MVNVEQHVQAELDDGPPLRAELVATMKRGYSMRGDGLLANMADAVIAAGWLPPEDVDAAVARGREDTAQRIAAQLMQLADHCAGMRAHQTTGQVAASVGAAAYRRAAQIAGETR